MTKFATIIMIFGLLITTATYACDPGFDNGSHSLQQNFTSVNDNKAIILADTSESERDGQELLNKINNILDQNLPSDIEIKLLMEVLLES